MKALLLQLQPEVEMFLSWGPVHHSIYIGPKVIGPKYIAYTYMDALGFWEFWAPSKGLRG